MKQYLTLLFALTISLWTACACADVRRKAINDFDGDGKTDVAIYYPDSGLWQVFLIGSLTVTGATTWAGPNCVPAPGDYDGDGKADFMVFDSATAYWRGQLSTGIEAAGWFGSPGTWPVPGDYDGDGTTEVAVYDPWTGKWEIVSLNKHWSVTTTWGALGDFRNWENPQTYTVLPMPFDYDQDGADDLAVYYRGWAMSDSGWYIRYARGGSRFFNWGSSGSLPAPGLGRSQAFDVPLGIGIYKVTTAEWFVPYLEPCPFVLGTYGETLPVPAGDYDGNGYDDNAVYNYVTGAWIILCNTGGGEMTERVRLAGTFGGAGAEPANIYSTIYKLGRYSPSPW